MHPGGSEILKDELGKNIDKPFEEAEHTKSARNIFKDLPIVGHMKGSETQSDGASTTSSNGKPSAKREDGQELESKFQFDYTKGLFVQLWHTEWTFDEYYQYINEPKHLVNPVRNLRLFDSDICELLTMCPWFGIPMVYIPLTCYYIINSLEGTASERLFWFCVGLLFWTSLEYLLHRFVFHMEDQFYFIKHSKFYAIHFLVHGVHHAFPCDAMRLVFPPILGFTFWFPFVSKFVAIFPPAEFVYMVYAGVLSGYVCYDMAHYFLHHSNPTEGTWAKDMKVYHMQHHYKNGTVGFGVTNKFWDRVFDTELTQNKIKKSD